MTTRNTQPNDFVEPFINQGNREGYVLAVIDDVCLVEYEMPAGTSSMYFASTDDPEKPKRSVSYKSLPLKWRRAILAAGLEWIGKPQASAALHVRLLPDGRVWGDYSHGYPRSRSEWCYSKIIST